MIFVPRPMSRWTGAAANRGASLGKRGDRRSGVERARRRLLRGLDAGRCCVAVAETEGQAMPGAVGRRIDHDPELELAGAMWQHHQLERVVAADGGEVVGGERVATLDRRRRSAFPLAGTTPISSAVLGDEQPAFDRGDLERKVDRHRRQQVLLRVRRHVDGHLDRGGRRVAGQRRSSDRRAEREQQGGTDHGEQGEMGSRHARSSREQLKGMDLLAALGKRPGC